MTERSPEEVEARIELFGYLQGIEETRLAELALAGDARALAALLKSSQQRVATDVLGAAQRAARRYSLPEK